MKPHAYRRIKLPILFLTLSLVRWQQQTPSSYKTICQTVAYLFVAEVFTMIISCKRLNAGIWSNWQCLLDWEGHVMHRGSNGRFIGATELFPKDSNTCVTRALLKGHPADGHWNTTTLSSRWSCRAATHHHNDSIGWPLSGSGVSRKNCVALQIFIFVFMSAKVK